MTWWRYSYPKLTRPVSHLIQKGRIPLMKMMIMVTVVYYFKQMLSKISFSFVNIFDGLNFCHLIRRICKLMTLYFGYLPHKLWSNIFFVCLAVMLYSQHLQSILCFRCLIKQSIHYLHWWLFTIYNIFSVHSSDMDEEPDSEHTVDISSEQEEEQQLQEECTEMIAHFSQKMLEALLKATRLSLDTIKKRVFFSTYVTAILHRLVLLVDDIKI